MPPDLPAALPPLGLPLWDVALRGAVAALLLHHLLHLLLPAPRRRVRLALAGFVASVGGYLACQQPVLLLHLPRPLAVLLLAASVGSAAWLWAAMRGLFDDHARLGVTEAAAVAALTAVGLAANLPWFPAGDGPFVPPAPGSAADRLGQLHVLLMLGLHAAALWEAARGWRDDLVASRRALRRWAAVGIVGYAGLALVVELVLRGRPVGPLLPALHVAVIGAIALWLSLVVARGSLAEVLGTDATTPPGAAAWRQTATATVTAVESVTATATATATMAVAAAAPARDTAAQPAPEAPALPARSAQALARLQAHMADKRAHRQDGLTLAQLASQLGLGEAALRTLINQQLGFRNFNDFLHHHRLADAVQQLAASDLPVLGIALECGYGSIGPFNRAFKQRFGMTPTDYRAAARQGAVLPPAPPQGPGFAPAAQDSA